MQFVTRIGPSDRAATVSDLDDFRHWGLNRKAGVLTGSFNMVLGGDFHLAFINQRTFGGGSTNVEDDEVFFIDGLAQIRRGKYSACRT